MKQIEDEETRKYVKDIHKWGEITRKDMDEIAAFERFIWEAIDDARFKHEQKEFFQKVIIDRDGRVHIKALTIPNDLEIVVKKAEEE